MKFPPQFRRMNETRHTLMQRGMGFGARKCRGTSPHHVLLFLASDFQTFISFERKVQIKFCFHIRVSHDEDFQIRSILNTF